MGKRVALWCAVFGLVFGLSSPQVVFAQEKVKVNLNEVVHTLFYLPQYVALEKKFFEKEGLEVSMKTGWGAHKVVPALLSGEADIGLIGPEPSLYMIKQGAQPGKQLINFAQLTQRDGLFLTARKPMPNFKWSDTKGKVILGWRKGSTPLMTLRYALYANGVDPDKDVEIVTNLEITAQPLAFKSGKGDFNLGVEPVPSLFEKEGVGKVVASIGLATGIVPYTGYVATVDYIKKNPQIIQKFTNGIYRGQLWVRSNSPEEIAKAVAPQFPKVDLDIITMSVRRYKDQDQWPKNPIFKKEEFNKYQDIIIYNKELEGRVDYDIVVNNEFARKAVEIVKAP